MASVRKRKFGPNKDREAWVVDYVDQHGKRRLKTFDLKKDAEAWKTNALHEVQRGIHTAASASITITEAAENWLTHIEREGRERATLAQYRQPPEPDRRDLQTTRRPFAFEWTSSRSPFPKTTCPRRSRASERPRSGAAQSRRSRPQQAKILQREPAPERLVVVQDQADDVGHRASSGQLVIMRKQESSSRHLPQPGSMRS